MPTPDVVVDELPPPPDPDFSWARLWRLLRLGGFGVAWWYLTLR